MSRMFLLLIPAAAPLIYLLGWYLFEVVTWVMSSGDAHLEVLVRASKYWWRSNFSSYSVRHGSLDFVLATCTLAFLVGCIVALVLHLILPRRSGSGRQSEEL